jgi:multidrug resistance protein, MATE family
METKQIKTDLVTEEKSEEYTLISYSQAIKKVLSFSGSYTLSRLGAALNAIGNGIVVARLSESENAAGSFVTTLTAAVLGTVRNTMLSTGMVIGEQDRKDDAFHQISNTLIKSWILAGILSIPTIVILLYSESILVRLNIQKEVAHDTQRFFSGLSYGIPAIFWLTCDQQFALGIKKHKVVLISGISYALLPMMIGFPLALTTSLGITGLGHGAAISGWLTLIGMRVYFKIRASEFGDYELYKIKCENIKLSDFSQLLNRGLALGFQNITEWANLLALSIMTGQINSDDLIDLQVSLRPISSYIIILMGLAQAVGVMVSRYRGASQKALEKGNMEFARIAKINARTIGNIGIIIGFSSSLIIGAIIIGLSNQLVWLLGDSEHNSYDDSLAKSLLLITSGGLLVDSIRSVASVILVGNNDPWVPPLLSFVFMSLLSAPAGGLISLYFKLSVNWLYITRDIGITLAAMSIGCRWLHKSNINLETTPLPIKEKKHIRNDDAVLSRVDSSIQGKNPSKCFDWFRTNRHQDEYYQALGASAKSSWCMIL